MMEFDMNDADRQDSSLEIYRTEDNISIGPSPV